MSMPGSTPLAWCSIERREEFPALRPLRQLGTGAETFGYEAEKNGQCVDPHLRVWIRA
jgi:hypothetical protein